MSRTSLLVVLCYGAVVSACAAEDASPGLGEEPGIVSRVAPFDRQLLLPGIADPSAVVYGDSVFIAGTNVDTRLLPIWRYHAGALDELTVLRPSDDPEFDYCHVWAADLTRTNDRWLLDFTATRVPNGTDCARVGIDDEQIFYTTSSAELPVAGTFAAPQVPDFGPGAPRSTTGGCPADGCDKAMRIDSSVFQDVDGKIYLSYVYFDRGNAIASIELGNPSVVVDNATPGPNDLGINEAPQMFRRGGRLYLMFSSQPFNQAYRLQYVMADSFGGLTKASGVHDLTEPVRRGDGSLAENAGHGTIINFEGRDYAIYHVGPLDATGRLLGRDTVVSPVTFREDGTLAMLNAVDVSWNDVLGREYSLDVHANGAWIGPCVGANFLHRATHYRLTDMCPSTGQTTPLAAVDQIRICHAANADWAHARCSTTAFDQGRDHVEFALD